LKSGEISMGSQLVDNRPPEGIFDWRTIPLDDGLLREPVMGGQGMALWFAGKREPQFQEWERVASVPHAEYTVEPGIGAVAAASVPLRQTVQGLWGKLWRRSQKAGEGRSWLMPSGEKAEQCGERRSDLLFVWAEQDTSGLDEAWIKSRWPASEEVRRLGKGLFLVRGVQPPDTMVAVEPGPNCPTAVAERLVTSARQSGDRRREATALTDFALMLLHENQVPRALALLEEALGVVRQLQDRNAEIEVLGHAGLAMLRAGQPQRALQLLEQRRSQAKAEGDRFGEKAALEHQGFAYAQLRDHVRSAACFEEAARLAHEVGHRKNEAELLWYLAVQHAEMGRREEAVQNGQAAVDLLEKARNPQAAWYADHLRRYRAGEQSGRLGRDEAGGMDAASGLWNGSLTAGLWQTPSAEPAAGGPGLLRMAVSAARSMAKFLGSGLKTTPAPTLQRRLRTCAACPHHTGLRCRLCGCFTAAKARMAHEECPIGKW
jgi:tetratricopeptide (TPR) repeat protein